MGGPTKPQIFRDDDGSYWRKNASGDGYEKLELFQDDDKSRWLKLPEGGFMPEPAGPTKENAAVQPRLVPNKQKTFEEQLSDQQTDLADKLAALNKKYEGRRALLQQDIEKGKKREWENKSSVGKLFSDPKRFGTDVMQKKRSSLGGVSFDDALVSDDPEMATKASQALTKNTILGTPVQFARSVPKAVARTAGNLGGAVVGGAARIPEWIEKALGDNAATDEQRKENYGNARSILEFAKEASSTGDRWAEGVDKMLPGKELGESSPISGLAEGAGNAAPTLAMLLATKGSDPATRAMISRLLVAEGASTGFNEATKADADPATAFRTALGMGGLRAVQNRLPISNMFKSRALGTTVQTPVDTALTNLLMHHATKSATGKDKMSFDDWTQGMVENWLQNYGMGKFMHDAAGDVDLSRVRSLIPERGGVDQKPRPKSHELDPRLRSRELRDESPEEWFIENEVKPYDHPDQLHPQPPDKNFPVETIKLSPKARVENTGENLWEGGIPEGRTLRPDLEKLFADRASFLENPNEASNHVEAKAIPDVEGEDVFHRKKVGQHDLMDLLNGNIEDPLIGNIIPRELKPVVERRWFEGLRKKPNKGRKDLAVQNIIQSSKGQHQADLISSADWASKFDLDSGSTDRISKWMNAAQTNWDLDPRWSPGFDEPVGGALMPKLSTQELQALSQRLSYNKLALDDFNEMQKLKGLPPLENANPYYDPHVYNKEVDFSGTPLEHKFPQTGLNPETNREKSRIFMAAVDPETGQRQLVAKTDQGYLPVKFDWDKQKTVFGEPLDITNLRIASALPREIRSGTGLTLNPQTFSNIATARADVRRAARHEGLAQLLRSDRELTAKGNQNGFRTPNMMTTDDSLNRMLYRNPNGEDRMLFRNDVSNVLEHFYGDKKFTEPSKAADFTQRLMDWYQRLTLANPLVHGPNVGEHATKQLGASDLMGGDPAEIGQLMKTAQSLRDTNDPIFQLFMATGGKDLTIPKKSSMSREALGGKNITEAGRTALGDPGGELTGLEGKMARFSDKMIWGPDANARFAFWLKNVQAGADPHQAHLDIARTQPNYNIPVNLFNEGAGGGVKGTANDLWRVLTQQGNRSPNTAAALRLVAPMFQRYRHNSIASTVNTAKDLASFTKEGTMKGLDKASVLAILNSGLYPALGEGLDQVFGDEDKHYAFPKPGSSHYLKLLSDWKKGAMGTAELADRIYTPPPAARVLYGAATGKDPMSGRSVEGELPGFAAESVLPQGFTLTSLLKNSGSAGEKFGMDDVTRMMKPFLATQLLGRSDRTDAEKVASYLVGKQVKPREQLGSLLDNVKQDQAWQAFTQALREGNKGDVDKLTQSGDLAISSKAINNATRKTFSTRPEELAMKLSPLSAEQSVEIFDEMTDDEKVAAYSTIAAKLASGKTKNEILRGQQILSRIIRETAAATSRLALSPYADKNPPMRRHTDALEVLGRGDE